MSISRFKNYLIKPQIKIIYYNLEIWINLSLSKLKNLHKRIKMSTYKNLKNKKIDLKARNNY